jgi:hypothetical protein
MDDGSAVVIEWTARKVRPVVLLYVAAVFVGFIGIAHFVIHSPAAVKALLLGSVGAIVPLVPTVLARLEFRLAAQKLERRPKTENEPKDFEKVFAIDELSHIVPTRHGFRFYKPVGSVGPLRRFWRLHLSDRYSGEVQVESADREHVLDALLELGVSRRA